MGQAAGGGMTSTYLGRYLAWRRPTNYDHLRTPQRPLAPCPAPTALPVRLESGLERLPVARRKSEPTIPLADLLTNTGTTALVVMHQNNVAWEFYPNNGSRDRLNRGFSVTKSIASALVGAAIGAGLIVSVEDQI